MLAYVMDSSLLCMQKQMKNKCKVNICVFPECEREKRCEKLKVRDTVSICLCALQKKKKTFFAVKLII